MNRKLLLIVWLLAFLCACKEDGPTGPPPEPKPPYPRNFVFNDLAAFNLAPLVNQNGDTAYFEVLAKATVSMAVFFWDTLAYNRVLVEATPLVFHYRVNGVKQQRLLALIGGQRFIDGRYGVSLAVRRFPLLGDYNLPFYVRLCTIYDEPPEYGGNREAEHLEIPMQPYLWTRSYGVQWELQTDSCWGITYNSYDSYHASQSYTNDFAVAAGQGIVKYMGYKRVKN